MKELNGGDIRGRPTDGPYDRALNFLGGSLPAALGSLPRLRTLHAYENGLNGSIPDSFTAAGGGGMPQLRELRLKNNLLTGKGLFPSLPPRTHSRARDAPTHTHTLKQNKTKQNTPPPHHVFLSDTPPYW